MGKTLQLLIQALTSLRPGRGGDHAIEELYKRGRPTSLERGARNPTSMFLCIGLLLFGFSFLFSYTLAEKTPFEFQNDHPQMISLSTDAAGVPSSTFQDLNIGVTKPVRQDVCKNALKCYEGLLETAEFHIVRDDTKKQRASWRQLMPTRAEAIKMNEQTPRDLRPLYSLVRYKIDPTIALHLANKDRAVFYPPRMAFQKADVFINGQKEATVFNSAPMTIPLAALSQSTNMTVDLLVRYHPKIAQRLIRLDREPTFLADWKHYNQYNRFMENKRSRQSRRVGNIARIVLAIFALLLFLVIETSPEALGLALFMGFDATAMMLGKGPLRAPWLPNADTSFFQHYCYAMGDIFKLYFMLQLARVIPPRISGWMLWGSLYSVPYAYLRYRAKDWGIDWYPHLYVSRDIFVGTVGSLVCLRTALYLFGKGLPWRVAAMCLASLATLSQTFSSGMFYFPEIRQFPRFRGFVSIAQANSAYMFALSAFFNVSTLESRVKILSRERIRAREIERELEVGRSVQQAFLEMPDLPDEIGLTSHYEAAAYVSGDTYYVHWNDEGKVLTFLLNDVTGHGIQAALKAFACNIVARSVWTRSERRQAASRLQRYDQSIVELICRDGEIPDFNAMVGAEFFLESGKLSVYRVNYNFPLLIEPAIAASADEPAWKVRQLAVANREQSEFDLTYGSFVVLLSDGFIESARDHRELVRYLRKEIASFEAPYAKSDGDTTENSEAPNKDTKNLTVSKLKSIALNWEKFTEEQKQDDRTMLVFQWAKQAKDKDNDSDSGVDSHEKQFDAVSKAAS